MPRYLGPGSRFEEERLHDRYRGFRGGDEETPYFTPRDTEIRDFVPNPDEIGDFEFNRPKQELYDYYEWLRNNPSRWL